MAEATFGFSAASVATAAATLTDTTPWFAEEFEISNTYGPAPEPEINVLVQFPAVPLAPVMAMLLALKLMTDSEKVAE
jgi:hypothetical protein